MKLPPGERQNESKKMEKDKTIYNVFLDYMNKCPSHKLRGV